MEVLYQLSYRGPKNWRITDEIVAEIETVAKKVLTAESTCLLQKIHYGRKQLPPFIPGNDKSPEIRSLVVVIGRWPISIVVSSPICYNSW